MLVASWPMPAATTLPWDLANLLGYLALAIAVFLFVHSGRPRPVLPFSGRVYAKLHRDLGYIAALALGGHIGLLLYAEPQLVEHLQPTAPTHMLAGLLSAVLLLLLVLLSITSVRRKLWRDYQRFRFVHAALAVVCLGFLLWHLVGSGYYLNHPWKIAALLALIAAAIYPYLTQRLARALLVGLVLLCSLLTLLALGEYWRRTAAPLQPMLPTAFEHADHAEEPCADCHHNFIDNTGGGACYNCHKMSAEINGEMEDMFHGFCWGCHIQRREEGEDSGPLRSCKGCHP